jgi:thermolabile hemolysin
MSTVSIASMALFGDSDTDGGAGAHGVYEITSHAWVTSPHFHGRFSNGAIWPEYFAAHIGINYDPRLNFAVGGAQTGLTNAINDERFANTGMLAQVQQYVHANPQVDPQTLFALWGGGNNFSSSSTMSTDEGITNAMRDFTSAVQQLQAADAQFILMGTLPSLHHFPYKRVENNDVHFRELSESFNTHLVQTVAALRSHSSARIVLADIAQLVDDVIANPHVFGFSNVTEPCVTDGVAQENVDAYLFWDGAHFTTNFHRILAHHFYQALVNELLPQRTVVFRE